MKVTSLFLLFLVASMSCISQPEVVSDVAPDHSPWTNLLKQHVTPEGLVRYSDFKREEKKLDNYLKTLSEKAPNPEKWSREEQLAYWINVYNAFTVKLVLDHYPVESIKDINLVNIPFVSSVWQKKFFSIGGEKMNLDHVEHSILRKEFNEPRIHFAINCASFSCPKLLNEAFLPKKIEEQLQHQAVSFINDKQRNKIDESSVRLSKIFKWFKKDFTKEGDLIGFVNKYSKIEVGRGVRVNYLDYNWKLNEGK
ncbi:MAG: DUF547 domain-containing protein [Bacteroidota bacterium]